MVPIPVPVPSILNPEVIITKSQNNNNNSRFQGLHKLLLFSKVEKDRMKAELQRELQELFWEV